MFNLDSRGEKSLTGGAEAFRIVGYGERGSASLNRGSGGCAPSGVQGQSPWSGGLGGEAPQKPKASE